MQTKNGFKQVIKDLQTSYALACASKNTLIVNDIQPDLDISTTKQMMSYLLSNIINVLISKSKDSCIRISAKKYNNVVLLHIKNNNVNEFSLHTPLLQQMQATAKTLGGCISTNNYRINATTVTVSFSNQTLTAA